ncbi:MAG TPA: MFS transporter [Vicinamibacterales bacterium]|nr:MFS transporter [Vicinamibacterales bacterium]
MHPTEPPGPPHWRRNQVTVTAAAFIGYTGFTLVMPFLPLYISELGVDDVGTAALWAGLSLGITPALTAVLSPVWGRLADRYGRKLMLERALASFVVVMTLMAFVTRPWQVFALRAVQGLFAGYGGLTIAMAAESAPPGRLASAIGTVQTAQRLGPAIGPVIGGVLAALVGLRRSFFVTAAVYFAALVLTMALYRERRGPRAGPVEEAGAITYRQFLGLPNFALLLAVIFGIQYVDRSLGPVLPLYLAQIGVPDSRAALLAGTLFSVLACSAAAGNYFCSRLLRRWPARVVIAAGSAASGGGILWFALLRGVGWMALPLAVFGTAVGVTLTAAFTAAGLVVPAAGHATGFGLLTGAGLAALALSPVVSGLIGARSMTAVFLLDVVLAGLVALLAWRRMRA